MIISVYIFYMSVCVGEESVLWGLFVRFPAFLFLTKGFFGEFFLTQMDDLKTEGVAVLCTDC